MMMTTYRVTIYDSDSGKEETYLYEASCIEGMFAQYEEDKANGDYGAHPEILMIRRVVVEE